MELGEYLGLDLEKVNKTLCESIFAGIGHTNKLVDLDKDTFETESLFWRMKCNVIKMPAAKQYMLTFKYFGKNEKISGIQTNDDKSK